MIGASIITILIIVLVGVIINGFEDYNKRRQRDVVSFKEFLELTSLPIATFKQGDKDLNFVLDTGANYSILNKKEEKNVILKEASGGSMVLGIGGELTMTEVKEMEFSHNKDVFIEEFQIMDISKTVENYKRKKGVIIHGILGNSFMQTYKYVLDFDKMIMYHKK